MMITDFNKNKNPLARLLTQKVTHSRHNDYRLQAKQISRVRLLTQEVNCSHHVAYRLEVKQISLVRLLTQ